MMTNALSYLNALEEWALGTAFGQKLHAPKNSRDVVSVADGLAIIVQPIDRDGREAASLVPGKRLRHLQGCHKPPCGSQRPLAHQIHS